MTRMKTGNMETVFNKGTETSVVQSFKPSLRQHWLLFTISAFSILLALTKFNVKTVTGLCIL
jgi:hypothetical protein